MLAHGPRLERCGVNAAGKCRERCSLSLFHVEGEPLGVLEFWCGWFEKWWREMGKVIGGDRMHYYMTFLLGGGFERIGKG